MKDNRKILITGSSGTIGTRLIEKLSEEDFLVFGIDKRKNKWLNNLNGSLILGDLRDKNSFEQIPNDTDMIVHLAANARVYDLVVKPDLAFENYQILFNVLEFAREKEIKKFIFASSREVYGNIERKILTEDIADVKNCESPYTASKIGGEALVHAYRKCYGLDAVILRFSNVYGMYDESDRVIPLFIRRCREEKELIVFGKDKCLDFTYIDDNIAGIRSVIEKLGEVRGQIFNIAYGEGTKLIDVAELIKKQMRSNVNIRLKENRTGEVVKYTADISKARERLGYNPKINIYDGLEKSIKWFNENVK